MESWVVCAESWGFSEISAGEFLISAARLVRLGRLISGCDTRIRGDVYMIRSRQGMAEVVRKNQVQRVTSDGDY